MTAGNLGTWQKNVGDSVAPGDILVDIETDKAQMDFEFQDEGFIAKILVQSGSKDVPVNTPIAVLVEDKDDVQKFGDFEVTGESSKAAKEVEQTESNETEVSKKADASLGETAESSKSESKPDMEPRQSDRVFASPAAKKLASDKGVDLKSVKGSGPNDRIVKSDIQGYKPSQAKSDTKSEAKPVPAKKVDGDYEDIALTNVRKVIATRLQESKSQIPHYYLTSEIHMDKLLKLRQVFNESADKQFKLSVNDFVVKAAAGALQAVPEVNSAWMDTFIRRHKNIDISVAVSTQSGLITPIVKNANNKGLVSISNAVKDMATRAKQNKLQPAEYQGGTFTISNLGMFDIQSFTAIINPPQSCILAVGSTAQKLVPSKTEECGFEVVSSMHVTLSCDHRVVDGAVGAQWLRKFKEYMENPLNLML